MDLTQDLTPIELPEHPSSPLDATGAIFPVQVTHLPDLPLQYPQDSNISTARAGSFCIDPANSEKSAATLIMQGGGNAPTLVDRGKTTLTPVTERSEPLSAQPSPSNGISGPGTAGPGIQAGIPTRRGSWKNHRTWRKGRNRNRGGGGSEGGQQGQTTKSATQSLRD